MHGAGDEAEEMVMKAIEKGFDIYSITEHLPLPDEFFNSLNYPLELKSTFQIRNNDLDAYVKDMLALKKKYRDKIQLKIGFEFDYLPDHVDYTKYVIREYGSFLDDSLLSIHFMRGKDGFRCVDLSSDDYQEGIINHYGNFEKAQTAYFQEIKDAVKVDWGNKGPKRIGHLTLYNKFQKMLNPKGDISNSAKQVVLETLSMIKSSGFELDVNVSGLFKEECGEVYPSPWILKIAQEMKIEMVYGSDAHGIEDVGRAYDIYEKQLEKGRQ